VISFEIFLFTEIRRQAFFVFLAHTRPDKKKEKESKFDYSNYIQARQINTQTAFFNIWGKDFVLFKQARSVQSAVQVGASGQASG